MCTLERSEKEMNFFMHELRLGRNALDISPKNQEKIVRLLQGGQGSAKSELLSE